MYKLVSGFIYKFRTPKKRKDFNDRNQTVILYYKLYNIYLEVLSILINSQNGCKEF